MLRRWLPKQLDGMEAAIFAAEAEVRWLDHCEAVILSNQHEGRNP